MAVQDIRDSLCDEGFWLFSRCPDVARPAKKTMKGSLISLVHVSCHLSHCSVEHTGKNPLRKCCEHSDDGQSEDWIVADLDVFDGILAFDLS